RGGRRPAHLTSCARPMSAATGERDVEVVTAVRLRWDRPFPRTGCALCADSTLTQELGPPIVGTLGDEARGVDRQVAHEAAPGAAVAIEARVEPAVGLLEWLEREARE